eukprot:GHVL01040392.1.p1 GENE.GHVL01040392.1~~GHVL01040392.1.p1  ORF type:complete len:609 (-),score=158.70 GHVL01040392.1:159-1985(-)
MIDNQLDEETENELSILISNLLVHRECSIQNGSENVVVDIEEECEKTNQSKTWLHNFNETLNTIYLTTTFCRIYTLISIHEIASLANDPPNIIQNIILKLIIIAETPLLTVINPVNDTLVTKSVNDTLVTSNKEPGPNTLAYRIQLRSWQALCCLIRFVTPETFQKIKSMIWRHLLANQQPDVRQYLQLATTVLAVKFPEEFSQILIDILEDFNRSVQCLSSVTLITGYLLNKINTVNNNQSVNNLSVKLFYCLIPYLTTNYASVRAVTQYYINIYLNNILIADSKNLTNNMSDSIILKGIQNLLKLSKDCIKMRQRTYPIFRIWDPVKLLSDRFGIYKILNIPPGYENENNVETVEITPFLKPFDDKTPSYNFDEIRPSYIFLQNLKKEVETAMTETFHPETLEANNRTSDIFVADEDLPMKNYQKKFIPLEIEADETTLLYDRVAAHTKRRQTPDKEIIVCASLLTKIPNIAGLTRSCEIFHATSILIPSSQILKENCFKSVAVSAELWIPIVPVAVSELQNYLKTKSDDGWTLIGVEQSNNSTKLEEFIFPKKCVLVMGSEKEGLREPFLTMMDCCVEISQGGVIRSLNVHVAASICLWKFQNQK